METVALPNSGEAAPGAEGGVAASAPGVAAGNGHRRVKPRSRAAARQEKAQASALALLDGLSSYLDSDEELPAFFARIAGEVAQEIGARRLAFWRIGGRGATLTIQPEPFGFDAHSRIHELRIQLGATGDAVLDRIVAGESIKLARGTCAELDRLWRAVGLGNVHNSVAVAWRAGNRRLGAIAAYDSTTGFATTDLWLLRMVGAAAGLVWQIKEAEDELAHTAVRLEEAVTARRQLLNNIAAGGDEARRRFASALHDDALQLLTGAELQLERIRSERDPRHHAVHLEQLLNTLRKVEDSLRRLLINVSPEALDVHASATEAIAERLESMRLGAGIEPHVDVHLPNDIPDAIGTIVLKNVTEALTNVEKHAHATRVLVAAGAADGGFHVEISDDGTGFVVAESENLPGHLGLLAMRERAQLAGGWCRIESEPGAGTKVEFWLPQNL